MHGVKQRMKNNSEWEMGEVESEEKVRQCAHAHVDSLACLQRGFGTCHVMSWPKGKVIGYWHVPHVPLKEQRSEVKEVKEVCRLLTSCCHEQPNARHTHVSTTTRLNSGDGGQMRAAGIASMVATTPINAWYKPLEMHVIPTLFNPA